MVPAPRTIYDASVYILVLIVLSLVSFSVHIPCLHRLEFHQTIVPLFLLLLLIVLLLMLVLVFLFLVFFLLVLISTLVFILLVFN